MIVQFKRMLCEVCEASTWHEILFMATCKRCNTPKLYEDPLPVDIEIEHGFVG
jgi:hypothetical protein